MCGYTADWETADWKTADSGRVKKNQSELGKGSKKVWNFPYFPKPTPPTRLVWKKKNKNNMV